MSFHNTRRFAAAIVVGLLSCPAAGCDSSPRFDASTEETAKASIEAMSAGKGEAEKKQLADDLAIFTPTHPDAALTGARKKSRVKSSAESPADKANDVFKSLDGLTAAEIHAKAEQTRRVRKSRSPN